MGTLMAWADQNNSLFKRPMETKDYVQPGDRGGRQQNSASGSAIASASKNRVSALEASWITVNIPQPKDFRVHDLIEIIVHEVSKHSTKADTKLERENDIDASLDDWIRFGSGISLRPDRQSRGDPKVKGGIEREFEGKGEARRQDELSARIMAEVIDILPNGNLVLTAAKTVTTDEDETVMTLTGTCRSGDVGPGNSLISSKLANLEVTKLSTGAARDATKRSFLHRFLDKFNPF
jgi:flagellar L-ring protein precursor FlgH